MLRTILILATLVGVNFAAINIPEYKKLGNESFTVLSNNDYDDAFNFENEYILFKKTGIESNVLKQLSHKLAKSHTRNIFTTEIEELALSDQLFLCTTCRATTNVLIRMFRKDGEMTSLDDVTLKQTMIELCNRFEIQTKETCEGIINIYFPMAKFLVQQSTIDSRTFCGTFLHASICKIKDESFDWKLKIDTSRPEIEGPKKEIPVKGNDDLKIVHITDIHYDPLYQPGALADCDEVLCCQLHKNVSENTSKAAGFWGDYRNCDIPWHTISTSLKTIRKNHQKIDFIYQTGDIVDHASWLGSREKNIDSLKKVHEELKLTFGDVPVYPIIGNHDSHPSHGFAPAGITDPELSVQWLYDLHAELWSKWLPASTMETIKKGGYYTVSPQKGFRLIALNNNDCYTLNFWILYNGSYPSAQLEWLHDTLLEAEKNGEHVHILAHVPSGISSCWGVWSREFSRIVERFSDTISGIFNGHSHYDEFSVYYSKNKTLPLNVAWNGGSLTTYNTKNPNYKIYQVEPTTFQVVDQEAWFFNLTSANFNPKVNPIWQREYKMLEAFNMTDLSPSSLDGLLTRFSEEPSLLRKYWCHFVVKSDFNLKQGCSTEVLKSLICRLSRSDNTNTKKCEMLQSKLQEKLDAEKADGVDSSCVCVVGGGAAVAVAMKLTKAFWALPNAAVRLMENDI